LKAEAEEAQIQRIKQILQKIELDGSHGIHNFSFIEELLTNSKKTLKSLSEKPPDE
ncbi:unnamed protein product, partial [marine sediment metagenome]